MSSPRICLPSTTANLPAVPVPQVGANSLFTACSSLVLPRRPWPCRSCKSMLFTGWSISWFAGPTGSADLPFHCVRLLRLAPRATAMSLGRRSAFHCVRLLLCPSGEAAFGPCSPPLAAARSSSGRDPAARLAAGSLAVPFASLRVSVSRRRCARWGPAASGAIAASPEGRIESPPPTTRRSCSSREDWQSGTSAAGTQLCGGVGGQNRPAGGGRWRRSVRVPSGRPAVGDSEGPRRGAPCSVARAGGSEGGARCAARATRPQPAGKGRWPHAVKRNAGCGGEQVPNAALPEGRMDYSQPATSEALLPFFALIKTLGLRQGLRHVGGGVVDPPVPRVAILLLRPRVPDGRAAPGCRWPDRASHAREETARGPGADRPVRSRAQEYAGSGAGAPGPASGHPRDRQIKSLRRG